MKKLEFKDFYKSTEAIVVIGGLFLTVTLGKLFAYITAATYILLNVPKAWFWVKKTVVKLRKWF